MATSTSLQYAQKLLLLKHFFNIEHMTILVSKTNKDNNYQCQ